jgi:hypothetical protein
MSPFCDRSRPVGTGIAGRPTPSAMVTSCLGWPRLTAVIVIYQVFVPNKSVALLYSHGGDTIILREIGFKI